MLFARINFYKHQYPSILTVTIKPGFQFPQITITNSPKTFLCMTNNILPYFWLLHYQWGRTTQHAYLTHYYEMMAYISWIVMWSPFCDLIHQNVYYNNRNHKCTNVLLFPITDNTIINVLFYVIYYDVDSTTKYWELPKRWWRIVMVMVIFISLCKLKYKRWFIVCELGH